MSKDRMVCLFLDFVLSREVLKHVKKSLTHDLDFISNLK